MSRETKIKKRLHRKDASENFLCFGKPFLGFLSLGTCLGPIPNFNSLKNLCGAGITVFNNLLRSKTYNFPS